MKQPEHLAGLAFNEARDRIAFLKTQLTETQKSQYAAFVKAQEKDKKEQKQKAARTKAEYEQAKEKRPGVVKNYDPPIKIKDPYLRQKALNAQAEYQNLNSLARTQQDEKIRFLEKLDAQRESLAYKEERQQEKKAQFRDNAQRMTRSRASPEFNRATTPKRQQEKRRFGRVQAKPEFQKAAKGDQAKDGLTARALARIRKKKKEKEEREREGKDDREGRERDG